MDQSKAMQWTNQHELAHPEPLCITNSTMNGLNSHNKLYSTTNEGTIDNRINALITINMELQWQYYQRLGIGATTNELAATIGIPTLYWCITFKLNNRQGQ